jgi:fido (protein-threonine AMPylation protein)
VSDEDDRTAEPKARETQREADLVQNRISELHEAPISGNFDTDHLKAIHSHIFQDLPHHRPGVFRADTADWIKNRVLEGRAGGYAVYYASEGVEARITDILDRFGGPESIKGLMPDVAAGRIAQLYGDLDHAHGFYEGNSRTLREFTRELASEAGYELDWGKTAIRANERNALYVARDLAVLERAFPDLTPDKAMRTNDRAEYEASFVLEALKREVGDKPLAVIIRGGLIPKMELDHQQEQEAELRGLGQADVSERGDRSKKGRGRDEDRGRER